jgi:hypothetical protein
MNTLTIRSLLTLGLALFFGWWGFRGAPGSNPIYPDASRHMMNGALLYDMIRTGNVARPVAFAQSWYARFPAITFPYHPPLFPLFETLFYAGFGVHYWVARLAIAATVALSVFLLAHLVTVTHRSYWLAVSAILVFFSLAQSQELADEIMLEFPALAMSLLSLVLLRDLAFDGEFTWRHGVPFALAASAAVWTRQTSLFLAGVPWFLVLLSGSWQVLRRGAIWFCSCVIVGSFAVFQGVQYRYQVGFNSVWNNRGFFDRVHANAPFYLRSFIGEWQWESVLLPLAIGYYIYLRWRRDDETRAANFYIAWILAAVSLHLVIPPVDGRYASIWDPALVVFTLAMMLRVLRLFMPAGRAEAAILLLAVLFFVLHINQPPPYFYGLDEAARAALGTHPGRIVSFGPNNGAVVAAVRAGDPSLQATVIRGDKLAASLWTEDFFHRFGISRIVIVHGDSPAPWDSLWNTPPHNLRLREEIAVRSSEPKEGRLIRVYDFLNPSEHPERILDVDSHFSKSGLHLVLP